MCLSHLIYTVRPRLIHTCHAMPMPCSDHAFLFKATAQHGRLSTGGMGTTCYVWIGLKSVWNRKVLWPANSITTQVKKEVVNDTKKKIFYNWHEKVLQNILSKVSHFHVIHKSKITKKSFWVMCGNPVAQLAEALRYKPEGRGFDPRWCHWNLSLT